MITLSERLQPELTGYRVDIAIKNDLEDILDLQKLAYQENAVRYNDFTIPPLTQTLQDLKKESQDSIILKTVEDNMIVGSVRAFEENGNCYIGKLIVHPDYQNKGIGKKLMKAIEKCFEGARFELFTGYFDEKNLAFYEKLGYKRFKEENVNENLWFVYLEKGAKDVVMDRMDKIKNHFEEEAIQYDERIKNLIPYYRQMVEALVNSLAFGYSEDIEVIDLGCGTGTISRAVKDVYPKAKITCVDISEKMLQIAAAKLNDAQHSIYVNSDFYNFNFDKKYNAVVSSLALHHLVTKEDKLNFYRKIYSCLNDGDVFVNADVVLASTDALQKQYIEQWKSFMYRNVSKDEVDNKWIPTYYEEDRPIAMKEHFEMLKSVGFKTMDVVWKYYNFAVYMAVK